MLTHSALAFQQRRYDKRLGSTHGAAIATSTIFLGESNHGHWPHSRPMSTSSVNANPNLKSLAGRMYAGWRRGASVGARPIPLNGSVGRPAPNRLSRRPTTYQVSKVSTFENEDCPKIKIGSLRHVANDRKTTTQAHPTINLGPVPSSSPFIAPPPSSSSSSSTYSVSPTGRFAIHRSKISASLVGSGPADPAASTAAEQASESCYQNEPV